ncbi:MAG: hypothetical protein CMN73_15875 [Sphingomonas sp.]|nr:hypothetical protein [Sphingomonas sp.]
MLGATLIEAPSVAQEVANGCAAATNPEDATITANLLALADLDVTADPAQSLARADALLESAQKTTICPEAWAIGWLHRGSALYHLQRPDEAIIDLQRARTILDSAGLADSDLMLSAIDMIGSTLADMGELDRALAIKQELLETIADRKGRDSGAYADALYTTGFIYYQKGEIDAALATIHEAVEIKRSTASSEDLPSVVMYWNSEAALLNLQGRLPEALESSRSVALWAEQQLGADHLLTASALHNFGALLGQAGQHAEAIPVLRRALDLRERLVGVDSPLTALTLNSLAYSLQRVGQEEEAEQIYLASAAIFEANPDSGAPQAAGSILLNAASLAAGSGRWEEALSRALRARELIADRAGTRNISYARAEILLSELALRRGDPEEALALLDPSVAILRENGEPYEPVRVRGEMLLAIAQYRSGNEEAGFAAGEAAYSVARDFLRGDMLDSARIRAEENYTDSLLLFASLAFRHGRPELGVEALQLARLGDLERSGRMLAVRTAATGAAANAVRELQDLLRTEKRLRAELSAAISTADRDAREQVETKLGDLQEAMNSARERVTALFPAYADLNRPSTTTIESVQTRLDADSVVIITHPGLEGVITVAITRDAVAWHLAPVQRNEYRDAVVAIREGVQDSSRPFPVDQAHLLYSAIFGGDIAQLIEGKSHLDVLAGGYLAVIPFSLLVERLPEAGTQLSDTPWLVRRFAISTPIDLSNAGRKSRTTGTVRFAGFGDPALAPPQPGETQIAALARGSSVSVQDLRELPSLPGAGAELAAMSRTLENPENLLLTGRRATETAIRNIDLTGFTVIAFATHGLVGGQIGGLDEPALVMTPPNSVMEDDDGLLTASEIARLRLNADWVILSACNTAAGAKAGTPTYSGLAQAFVFAGARSLLLSHWRVRDDAAARLSVGTVRGAAQGLDKAEALREAQLDLMADPDVPDAAHPAVWAPFILIES